MNLQYKIQVQERRCNAQEVNVVQYKNLNQCKHNKIKRTSQYIINHFVSPLVLLLFVLSAFYYL